MRNEWITQRTAARSQSQAATVMLYFSAFITEFCDLDEIAQIQENVKVELAKITEVS